MIAKKRPGLRRGQRTVPMHWREKMQFEHERPLDEDGHDDGMSTMVAPQKERRADREQRRQPRYHVVLWDSDNHTFDYVHQMLTELFAHTAEQCQQIAEAVHTEGRAIVLTTTREHAELKRDQIHAYGKDRTEASHGSMHSTIEPEC